MVFHLPFSAFLYTSVGFGLQCSSGQASPERRVKAEFSGSYLGAIITIHLHLIISPFRGCQCIVGIAETLQ